MIYSKALDIPNLKKPKKQWTSLYAKKSTHTITILAMIIFRPNSQKQLHYITIFLTHGARQILGLFMGIFVERALVDQPISFVLLNWQAKVNDRVLGLCNIFSIVVMMTYTVSIVRSLFCCW